MKVHHLSCGTMCPFGGSLMDGFSHGLSAKLVCHCLAIETEKGLVLVDTGFGTQDIQYPQYRLSRFFLNFNRVELNAENTALYQIEKLGFQREDVRHIILTHLDFDHAGGISDFPQAMVHLMGTELRAARNPKTWLDRNRYRRQQWSKELHWNPYSVHGDKWHGFSCVKDLNGLPPEILLVPLAGHTHGHSGVAIETDTGWLLHAGDAYFYRGEMDPERYSCTVGLKFYQKMMEVDRQARLWNQHRLRELVKNNPQTVKVFSAHDAIELSAFQRRAPAESLRATLSPSIGRMITDSKM